MKIMQRSQQIRIQKNIFIVSTKLELRLILSKEFSQYGYQIFEFANTQQILPFLKIKKPDILIIHYSNDQSIHFHIAEILEEAKQNCFIIFLVNEKLLEHKSEFLIRLDILRIGANQIFYINEENLFLPTNNILKEIDHYFDIQISGKSHILYIINEEEYNDIYIELLRKENFLIDVIPFYNLEEYFNKKNLVLLQELYSGIILNLYYRDFLGIELIKFIRQFLELKHIPVFFIGKDQDINRYLYAIQKGGDAFILHPSSPEFFITIVNSHCSKYKVFKTNLEKDLMTNLYNHHSLLQKLEMKINIYQKAMQGFAYALIDIDKFKAVNDKYGHQAGDQVIINLARFLKHNLREYDIIGRYGGEEFAVILTRCIPYYG